MPTHWTRSHKNSSRGDALTEPKASLTKTTTTQARITANDRATRSRRLKDSAYISRENAVMAMPAVNSWFRVRRLEISAEYIKPSTSNQ